MPRINWNLSDVVVSGKEVVYVISLMLSLSGLYYKSYYTDVIRDQQFAEFQKKMLERVVANEKENVDQNLIIRQLQDAELKRRTLEENSLSSKGYIPFNNK